MALRLRRGTDAERLLVTPLQGEPIFTTDTKRLYVGDGSTIGGVLVTGDTSNTEVGADTTPQLGGDLDLNSNNIVGTGNISIDGTITATGNISLGDSDADTIDVGGLINTNLRPAIDGAYNIGSAIRRWNNIYAEGAQIDGEITAQNLVVGNIIGADSTVYLNTETSTITATNFNGTFTGDFNGNITGDSQGFHTGRVSDLSVEGSVINNLTTSNATITGGTLTGIQLGTPTNGLNIEAQSLNIQGTATGNLQGNVTGNVVGDIRGSVFANDSTMVIDSTAGGTVLTSVDNTYVSTSDLTAATVVLSGTNATGEKAGLRIVTDGNADDSYSLLDIDAATNSDVGSSVVFSKSRGTHAARTSVQDGDEILGINYFGYDSNNAPAAAAVIQVSVDGTPTAGNVPGSIVFGTTNPVTGTVAALMLNSQQHTIFNGAAKLVSYADATARDAAITSPSAGMLVFITGTGKAQVYTGASWVDLH